MSKSKVFYMTLFLLFTFTSVLRSYSLKHQWLPASTVNNPLVLNMHTSVEEAMGVLGPFPINFDPAGATERINWEDQARFPYIVLSDQYTSDENVRPIVIYKDFGTLPAQREAYGVMKRPGGMFADARVDSDFIIELNSTAELPWNSNGGGTEGGVDINTVFLHELGHAFGLGHFRWDRYFFDESVPVPDPNYPSLMLDGMEYSQRNFPPHFFLDDSSWAGLMATYISPEDLFSPIGKYHFLVGEEIVFVVGGMPYVPYPEAGDGFYPSARFHAFIQYPGEDNFRGDEMLLSINERLDYPKIVIRNLL